jgi:hypothetical protein
LIADADRRGCLHLRGRDVARFCSQPKNQAATDDSLILSYTDRAIDNFAPGSLTKAGELAAADIFNH